VLFFIVVYDVVVDCVDVVFAVGVLLLLLVSVLLLLVLMV